MTNTAEGTRKPWYGSGEQPWDIMKDIGWSEHFAAGCILKYMMRTKEPEHSLESARWYWARLGETKLGEICKIRLRRLLTFEQCESLEVP